VRLPPLPLLIGAPNFRDFGGCPTAGGGRVRCNVLFRSEGLAQLTDADLEVLSRFDIRLVCDLRTDFERRRWPSRWPERHSTRWLNLEVVVDVRAGHGRLRQLLEQDPTPAGARAAMLETYRLLPRAAAPVIARLAAELAGQALPVLIHCAAGKDRTGFACACLLHLLGVPRTAIIADYLESGRQISTLSGARRAAELMRALLGIELDHDTLLVLNGVAPEFLDAAIVAAAEQHGSLDAYLEQTAGVDTGLRRRLREALLE